MGKSSIFYCHDWLPEDITLAHDASNQWIAKNMWHALPMLDGSGLIHVVTTCSLIVLSVLLQHQSVQVLVSHRQWAILEHRLMNQKRGPQDSWADCAWFNRFTTFRLLECQDCRIFITWNRPSCGGYNPDHLVIDYHQYCKIFSYWWCHIS